MSRYRFDQKIALEGWVSLQVVNGDGSVDQELDPFKNVILDQGLDNIADGADNYATSIGWRGDQEYTAGTHAGLVIGVGDTTPSRTDSGLENQKATIDNILQVDGRNFPANGSDPYTWNYGAQFETNKGDLDSSTDGDYKELGLIFGGYGVTNKIGTRTLIKDSNGDPTSISVASDQKLRVWYYLYVTVTPSTTASDTFDITNLGTFGYTYQPINVSQGFASGGVSPDFFDLSINSSAGAQASIGFFKIDRDATLTWPDIGASWDGLGGNELASFGFKDLVNASVSKVDVGVYDLTMTWGTNEANGTRIDGIRGDGTWAALFDEANAFTKDDLHELTITWRLTYTRP